MKIKFSFKAHALNFELFKLVAVNNMKVEQFIFQLFKAMQLHFVFDLETQVIHNTLNFEIMLSRLDLYSRRTEYRLVLTTLRKMNFGRFVPAYLRHTDLVS